MLGGHPRPLRAAGAGAAQLQHPGRAARRLLRPRQLLGWRGCSGPSWSSGAAARGGRGGPSRTCERDGLDRPARSTASSRSGWATASWSTRPPPTPSTRRCSRRAEEDFEDARYLHLVRHPYGMIHSFEEAKLDQVFFRHDHPFTRRELAELIWLVSQREHPATSSTGCRRSASTASASRTWCATRSRSLRGLCGFLGLDFHPAMAAPLRGRRSRRMTDGLHAESRMLGDVKFHQHRGSTRARGRALAGGLPGGLPGRCPPADGRRARLRGPRRNGKYRRRFGAAPGSRASRCRSPSPRSGSGSSTSSSRAARPTTSPASCGSAGRPGRRRARGAAWTRSARRHESLRTVFATTAAGTGPGRDRSAGRGPAGRRPLGPSRGCEEAGACRVARAEEARRPFDLARGLHAPRAAAAGSPGRATMPLC